MAGRRAREGKGGIGLGGESSVTLTRFAQSFSPFPPFRLRPRRLHVKHLNAFLICLQTFWYLFNNVGKMFERFAHPFMLIFVMDIFLDFNLSRVVLRYIRTLDLSSRFLIT